MDRSLCAAVHMIIYILIVWQNIIFEYFTGKYCQYVITVPFIIPHEI